MLDMNVNVGLVVNNGLAYRFYVSVSVCLSFTQLLKQKITNLCTLCFQKTAKISSKFKFYSETTQPEITPVKTAK